MENNPRPKPLLPDNIEPHLLLGSGLKPHERRKVLLGGGLLIVLIALTAAVLLAWGPADTNSKTPPAKQTAISDTNYNLVLPAGWQAADSYSSGAGLGSFIDTQSQSRITVFVTPKQSGQTADTHIDREITGLKKNGGGLEVASDQKKSFGGISGRQVAVLTGKPSDPNDKTYYLYVGIDYKDVTYNLDVRVPQAEWPANQAKVMAAIDSFSPKSATFKQPNATR